MRKLLVIAAAVFLSLTVSSVAQTTATSARIVSDYSGSKLLILLWRRDRDSLPKGA
jgi:hypothetical protein